MILKPQDKTDSLFSVIRAIEEMSFTGEQLAPVEQLHSHFIDDDVFVSTDCYGSIVAHCIVEPRPDGPGPYIYSIATHPLYRGRGWAGGLLTQAEVEYRSKLRDSIDLHVQVDNVPAIVLYLKHGYRVRDYIRNYYGKDGSGLLMRTALYI